jgi:chromosomal replication initiation ATPase DnaA
MKNHTSDTILEAASEFYSVPIAAILSKNRKEIHTHARHMCVALFKKHLRMNMVEIAFCFNYKDHTGIHYAIKTINGELTLPSIFSTSEEMKHITNLSFSKANNKT